MNEDGWVIWLTGMPASGKSTIARALQRKLAEDSIECVMLDSDELRSRMMDLRYDSNSRDSFYRNVAEIASTESIAGNNVIIAATGHRANYRDYARAIITRFAEVWVDSSIEEVRSRDRQRSQGEMGLYERADAGEITSLPGVNVVYEQPPCPEVRIDTMNLSPEEAVDEILFVLPFFRN